jgi:hypothetical protein
VVRAGHQDWDPERAWAFGSYLAQDLTHSAIRFAPGLLYDAQPTGCCSQKPRPRNWESGCIHQLLTICTL